MTPEPTAVLPAALSVEHAAIYLDCSKNHVYDLIATRRLPATHIGGNGRTKTRIRVRDLDAFLAENLNTPKPT